MRCCRILIYLAVTTLSISTALAQNVKSKLSISHHERISDLTLAPPDSVGTPAPAEQTSGETRNLSVTAFGKTFALELKANQRLIADLPSAQQQRLAKKIKLYRGQLVGVKGSWVRLTQNGTRFSGMIWDGSEMYVIDQSDEIASSLRAPEAGSYPLMYKLKDAAWPDAQCALDPGAKPINDYGALVQELNNLAQALPASARELPLAIVADAQFVQANPLDPEAAVVARMNVVDGIFSEQIGVDLRIAQIRSLQNNATLTATSPNTLLTQFSNYASAPGFTNPGLAHLFTGRDLDGSTIGIAYLSSLCSARFGTGISQTTGTGTAGALIVAHELGHNFGAPHDNQAGSACATSPNGFIMNPSANGSRTFSSCSVTQMQPVIAGAACITPITVGSADLRPVLPVNPINAALATNFAYRVEVRNGGGIAATGATATIAIPNGLQLQSASVTQGACTNAATQVACNLGNVAAAAAPVITLNLRAPSAGRFTSNIVVAASNDGNATNNSTQAVINIGGSTGATTLFESHFDTSVDGFTYVDDAFRATRQPLYASGARVATGGFSGGGLNIALGAINNNVITNMSGGWRRSFSLPAQRRVSVALRVKLNQSAFYESDEISQALLAIDGRLVSQVTGRDYLAQLRGDGNSGSALTSGWLQLNVDLGVLNAGTHSITIGAHNNKKTLINERTDLFIDDIVVTAQ